MKQFNPAVKEYISAHFLAINAVQAEFDGVVFESCEFKDCDFTEAAFTKCKFSDCRFINCNLSVVNLGYSQFRAVEFEGCKIIGVNWTKAHWPRISFFTVLNFQRCILNDSSFFGLALEEIIVQECKAHDVDFRGTNLRAANLSHTDFTNSLFNKTNLSAADFTEAMHYDIDILNNDIRKAKFSRYEAVRLLQCLDIELVD